MTIAERIIEVDESLYSKEAVLQTCYWFTDRAYLLVSRLRPGVLAVRVRAKTEATDIEVLEGEFQNSLLDYELRAQIEARTGTIRELIVAKALAEGDILNTAPPGELADPVDLKKLVQIT